VETYALRNLKFILLGMGVSGVNICLHNRTLLIRLSVGESAVGKVMTTATSHQHPHANIVHGELWFFDL